MLDVLVTIRFWLEAEESFALATVIAVDGSAAGAFAVGLTCGGSLRILIQRLTPQDLDRVRSVSVDVEATDYMTEFAEHIARVLTVLPRD